MDELLEQINEYAQRDEIASDWAVRIRRNEVVVDVDIIGDAVDVVETISALMEGDGWVYTDGQFDSRSQLCFKRPGSSA